MIAWMIAAVACAQIAPDPLSVDIDADERLELRSGTYVVFADEAAATDAGWFDALNAAANGGLLRTTARRYNENDVAIYVGVNGRHTSFRERRQRRWLDALAPAGPQGYRLLIDQRGVLVAGTDEAGVVNGVAMLIDMFADDGSLPYARVRDEPEIGIRGIRLRDRPDGARIRELASARCNLAIIESSEGWSLNSQSARAWRTAFAELRAAGIEPVPAIDLFAESEPLSVRLPSPPSTRPGIDQFVLTHDAWSPLSHPNVVESADAPIRVRAGGEYFEPGRDFVIAPPKSNGEAWQIRRIAGGAIPEGASVDVLYSYGSSEPSAAYWQAIGGAVSEVARLLEPGFLYIGVGYAGGRGRDQGMLAESLSAVAKAVKDDLRLIVDANAFRDEAGKDAMSALPPDAVLDVRAPFGPPAIGASGAPDVAWARALGRPLLLSAPSSSLDALATCEIAARTPNVAGVIGVDADVVRMAWAPARSTLPWPRVLNAYFGARLWKPDAVVAFQALAAHANAQTVRSVRPETELETFRNWFERNRGRIPAEDAAFVEGHYTRILEWIQLESEFRRGNARDTLRDLIDLVQRHAGAIPEYPEDRRSTIVHTIDSAGRFVPSNILFGTPVLPYRAVNLPSGHTVLEVPVRPEFSDHQGTTEALFDVLETPGPILRIDFDTLDPTAIAVDRSLDGKAFETVQRLGDGRTRPPGPPVFIQRPFSAAAFRVTVEGNPPILRDPRVFALKDVPAAVCSRVAAAPELEGSFRERGWPSEAQIAGFMETTQARFAAVATTVRVMYTRDALYLGVYAREPRMDTMVSEITQRDGPLWTEEAVDVRLGAGNDEFIFAVSPNGSQFDSKNRDAHWNGEWAVYSRLFTTGWSAEIEIPFETLGTRPRTGDDWRLDVVRYRCNVERSTSHWAYRPGESAAHAPGRLVFN